MDRKAIIKTIVINPEKKETCLKLNASTANKLVTWLPTALTKRLRESSVLEKISCLLLLVITANKQDTWLMNVLMSALKDSTVVIEVMIDLQEEAMVTEELEVEGVAMVIEELEVEEVAEAATSKEIITNLETTAQ